MSAAGLSWWLALPLLAAVAFLVRAAVLRRVGREARRLADSIEGLGDRTRRTAPVAEVSPVLAPIATAALRTGRRIDAEVRELSGRVGELEAIFRSTDTGLVALDAKQRILDLNPAAERLLAATAERARGRFVQEITRHPSLHAFLDRAFAAGDELGDDCLLDGIVPVAIRALARPLRDGGGRPVGLLLALQDITRIRRLEEMRTDFVANVSHELRTPITNIKGYIETLLEIGAEEPETVRRFLEIARRNTQRLASLVEDLLTLASLDQAEQEGERHPLVTTSVAAADIVETVREQVAPVADARQVEVRVRVEEGLEVEANRVLVEQALFNLVSNAIRYGGEGKPVDIEASAAGADAVLSVRDRGPGIVAKHLPRIFERFYRVDRARARADGGTGLGLAIVKHIATVHRGSVEVDSTVGEGSVFRLRLPRPILPVPPEGSASTTPVSGVATRVRTPS